MLESISSPIKSFIKKFPRLAMRLKLLRRNIKRNDTPVKTPLGFKLCGNHLMQNGSFEPEETSIVESILPEVDTFVNIGANIGYYSCIALKHNKQVIAFEPEPDNIYHLTKNIKANNWSSDIEINPIALSDSVNVIELYGCTTGASIIKGWANAPSNYSTLVPCNTLNNIVSTRLKNKNSLILVDIEGAELMMLKGASQILQNSPKPIWIIEICISEHQPDGNKINPNLVQTFKLLFDAGYKARTADKEMKAITLEEITQISKTKVDTLTTHNFLFLDANSSVDITNSIRKRLSST